MNKIDWHHHLIRVVIAILVLVGVFCLFHFFLEPYMPTVDNFIAALGFWGPVLFVVLLIIGTTIMFPESIFALTAGAIFGVWWGLLWMTIAGVLASFVMFFIGRHIFKNPVENLLRKHPKLKAFDEAASSFKIIALLRLSPFSFTALCYLVSVSKAKFSSYAYASIAMIPGFLSTTYIGYAAKHAADLAAQYKKTHSLPPGDSVVHEITVYGGLVVAVSVSIIVAKVALRTVKNCNSNENLKSPNH
ncbi:TVP38/TMEM64 family protein [bacterium]|nr:TVP38/TMEM64 family protein [bacterium]